MASAAVPTEQNGSTQRRVGRVPERREVVRRAQRPRRRQLLDRGGLVRLGARPERLRQDDADARDRRAHRDRHRRDPRRRASGRRAAARGRDRLPAVRADAVEDDLRQRRLRPRGPRRRQGADRRPRPALHRPRPPHGLRALVPVPGVGRHAAARRSRTGARRRAAAAADGRAVRVGRRDDARGAPRRAARHLGTRPAHGRLHHPLDRRGDRAQRRHLRHVAVAGNRRRADPGRDPAAAPRADGSRAAAVLGACASTAGTCWKAAAQRRRHDHDGEHISSW